MILVTGATGFVGRHVVQALAAKGYPVRALVRTPSRASVLPADGVDVAVGDVLDPSTLSGALERVETVVHLVAVISEHRHITFQRVNYEGTRNVLAAAVTAGVRRIVYISAIGASSDPSLPYLYSKWMAEQEVARSGLAYNIVRFSVMFGEGDEFINRLAALVKLMPLVPVIGDGNTRLQPIAVEDAATFVARTCASQGDGDTIVEVGGPDVLTYRELLDLVAQTMGVRIAKMPMPVSLARPAVALMEKLVSSPPITLEQIKMLAIDNVAGPELSEERLGFALRPLTGNIGYVFRIGLMDALKMNLGSMPSQIRDH